MNTIYGKENEHFIRNCERIFYSFVCKEIFFEI